MCRTSNEILPTGPNPPPHFSSGAASLSFTARIERGPSLPYSHLVRVSEVNSDCGRRTTTFRSGGSGSKGIASLTRTSLFLKDQSRLRHITHRDRHQLPPACSKLVQLGLHILGVRKYLDDFVLEPFWLLSLRCKRLPRHKQEPQRTKTDSC
jgi:hypothetical protein